MSFCSYYYFSRRGDVKEPEKLMVMSQAAVRDKAIADQSMIPDDMWSKGPAAKGCKKEDHLPPSFFANPYWARGDRPSEPARHKKRLIPH